jgi:hypothetical protein
MRLAADGDYREALERCIMVRRFARQVGGENDVLCKVLFADDTKALKCIQFILNITSLNEEIYKWLQSRFNSVQDIPRLFTVSMEREFIITLRHMRISPNLLKNIRVQLSKSTGLS